MTFTFNPAHMADDLDSFSKGAAKFLQKGSKSRIDQLRIDLVSAVASAKKGGGQDFVWRTRRDNPILFSGSQSWKGGTDDFDTMTAEISIDYLCSLQVETGRVWVKGAVVITFRDSGNGGVKVVHFDTEEGGWREVVEGRTVERAAHPPFHSQFHGAMNDIPRLPSLIVHPIDVLNFAVMELHQKHWRKHIDTAKAKTLLRHLPKRQRERLRAILHQWDATVGLTYTHALIAMQRPFPKPLEL
ncbi:hypothetical protein [Histidinibacterium aquaticum]|uniref:Uncharacterized protein n=1 Tax=Histidinibacterium aquaticum TaxID=2613962 RepID=A0A5J5GQM2_9RHOB|nr:hypothetical protein [Histidinibacterium aquaticum]KAA9010357.1 hypothetical protein F3S47_03685 [Histidinibacterium aquaticum]